MVSIFLDLVVDGSFDSSNSGVHPIETSFPHFLVKKVPSVLFDHQPNGLNSGFVKASSNDSTRWTTTCDVQALEQLCFFEEMKHRVPGKVGNRPRLLVDLVHGLV